MSPKNLPAILYSITLLGVLLFSHFQLASYTIDDAYIHFRIAANFAEWGQPYYHLDQPLLTSSSILWTLILSGLAVLFSNLVLPVSILNACITTMAACYWGRLVERIVGSESTYLYILSTITVVSILFVSSVGLMETPLAVLLLGVGFYLYLCSSPLGFVFLTLAFFVRPEMVVPWLLVSLLNCYERRVSLRPMGIAVVVSALPLAAFQLYSFSTIVPHAIEIKKLVYDLSIQGSTKLVLAPFLNSSLFADSAYVAAYFLILLLLCFTIVIRGRFEKILETERQGLRFLLLVLVVGLIIAGAYLVQGVPVFLWYIPLYMVPIVLVILMVSCISRQKLFVVSFAVLVIPIFSTFLLDLYSATGAYRYYSHLAPSARVRKYISVAEQLYAAYPEGRLLSSEMGGLGFGFKGRLLDGVGLISPEAERYHPMRVPEQRANGLIGAIPAQFVADQKPEFIVSLDIFAAEFLDSEVSKEYELISQPVFLSDDSKLIDSPGVWGSEVLWIGIRSDIAHRSELAVLIKQLSANNS